MKTKILFLGNGPLANNAKQVLSTTFDIIFHAHTKSDLLTIKKLKLTQPSLPAVLASFGIIIEQDLLKLFEPTGILNIHPSLLPKYRGASPIETAILNGDKDFSVSIIKLSKKMDAGPIYYQTTIHNLPLNKADIYRQLATTGVTWLCKNLLHLPLPKPQNERLATFTTKLDKTFSLLTPNQDSAITTLRKIIAYQNFPKPKYSFLNQSCIILSAHLLKTNETAPLTITCQDGKILAIDYLQPENKRPMDAQSFLNGYSRDKIKL